MKDLKIMKVTTVEWIVIESKGLVSEPVAKCNSEELACEVKDALRCKEEAEK